mmetsp:Transcript_20588/g.43665  ORF Transcript_20588/g.43665 Transcript_20588/m.43665 type:complete len:274 (-) Transcript_20588:305-1126(-)
MIKQSPIQPPRRLPAPRAHNLYIPTPKKKHKLQPVPQKTPTRSKPITSSIYCHDYKHAAKALMLQHMGMAGGSIWDEELQKFAAYRDLSKHPNTVMSHRWTTSGRSFQGFLETKGMYVLKWINRYEVPKGKTVTYPRYTVDIRPKKSEPYRTRITAGGNLLDYDSNVTTHTASTEIIKCHWKSVLSTKGAKYCTGDISNMYLCSWLKEAEYVRFHIDSIPPRIVEHYKLQGLVHNGYVYARIKPVWYGLKQSGKIAHDDLVEHLSKYGYERTP